MRVLLTFASFMLISTASAELAEGDVTKWLASMDDVKAWTSEHSEQIQQESLLEKDLKSVDSIYTKALSKLGDLGLYDSFNSMIQSQGYSSANDWALVSQDITNAYMAVKMDSADVNVDQLKAQLAQIDSSPLPPAQKKMMSDMISRSVAMMENMKDVPAGDKAAISPYIADIERVAQDAMSSQKK